MLKKTITYTDFNDQEVTEDFFFHLSKTDMFDMEVEHKGGLKAYLEEIIKLEDHAKIVEQFKNLILKSYGQKSSDGRRFIKNEQLREEFMSMPAYEVLFMELATDAGAAADFINGIVPQGLAAEAEKIAGKGAGGFSPPKPKEVDAIEESTKKPRVLTKAEMLQMPHDELTHLLATGKVVAGGEE